MIVQVPNPAKAWLSYAVLADNTDTRIVKSHTTKQAAQRASNVSVAKLRADNPTARCQWGWTEVTARDIRHGIIL